MSLRPFHRRVEMLESEVNALNQLPVRVEAVEVRLVELTRDLSTLRDDFVSFRLEVRNEFSNVRSEAAAMEERLHAGHEETRRQMRVLHEDVIARFALLQEGLTPPTAVRAPSRRRSRKRR